MLVYIKIFLLALLFSIVTCDTTNHTENSSKKGNDNAENETNNTETTAKKQKLLLISLDGFRWDFQGKTHTPALDKVVKEGVSTEFVVNVFPTSTIPNHQSIVTGLYPENHGMLDNNFMDQSSGLIFKGQPDVEWWNESIPIWIENEQQGHKSGVAFWPGYNVKYDNVTIAHLPSDDYVAPYKWKDGKVMSIEDRLFLTMNWLKDDNVTFVALYCEHADETAHNYPPDSNLTENVDEMQKAIKKVDYMVGWLLKELEKENLLDIVNIVMIGDHGMIHTSHTRQILIDDYIDSISTVRYIGGFTNIFYYTYPNSTDEVYRSLKKASEEENSHFKVFRRIDIPEYLHVKNNKRTADILMLPDPGWVVLNKKSNMPPYLKGEWERGDHGYDITERKMSPAFYAIGPSFRSSFRKRCIKTVDIYSLMCYILDLKPHMNDGVFGRIKPFLQDFASQRPEDTINYSFADEDDPIKCY